MGHDLKAVESVSAIPCKADGTKAHYMCTRCDKLFSDETGKTEVTKESLTISRHFFNSDGVCTGCQFHESTGCRVFYDCDADNDSGNADGLISTECGWRYLEAAPADLRLVNGVPTVGFISSGECGFRFGYYRTTDDGSHLYVNGTKTYNAADCTGTAIGTGKTNTQLLVDAMGAEAYSSRSGSGKTAYYAAKLCDDLTYTYKGVTYSDWFLPSKDELNLMYTQLKANGMGFFSNAYYWSSSESSNYASDAWAQAFYNGDQTPVWRDWGGRRRSYVCSSCTGFLSHLNIYPFWVPAVLRALFFSPKLS